VSGGVDDFSDLGNFTGPVGTNLVFTEYVEGAAGENNDVIEIYNATGADINLANYRIERYDNTNGQATRFPTYYSNDDVNLDPASVIV
jgi:hypothetical protein